MCLLDAYAQQLLRTYSKDIGYFVLQAKEKEQAFLKKHNIGTEYLQTSQEKKLIPDT